MYGVRGEAEHPNDSERGWCEEATAPPPPPLGTDEYITHNPVYSLHPAWTVQQCSAVHHPHIATTSLICVRPLFFPRVTPSVLAAAAPQPHHHLVDVILGDDVVGSVGSHQLLQRAGQPLLEPMEHGGDVLLPVHR